MGMVYFGDIAEERRETIKTKPENCPIVGLEHITPGDIRLSDWDTGVENTFTKAFRKGDILFGRRRAYLKKAAVAPFDGICSGDITTIKAKEDKILPELLPFIVQNDAFFDFAVGKSAGSLSPRVKWEHLKTYQLNLPSMEEQKRLVKILMAAEETRQAYKKLIKQTDDLVKSRFADLVQDFKTREVTLSDVAQSWFKGQPFKKEQIEETGGKNLCIHYGELFTKYGPIIDTVVSQTNADMKKPSKKGDILFPASDVTPNGLTRCSVINIDNVLLGGDIIVLRPNTNDLLAEYLSYAINYQKEQLLQRVTGQLVKHIKASSLQSVRIPVITMEKQQEFINFVYQIKKMKLATQQSLDALNETVRALVNRNFN